MCKKTRNDIFVRILKLFHLEEKFWRKKDEEMSFKKSIIVKDFYLSLHYTCFQKTTKA